MRSMSKENVRRKAKSAFNLCVSLSIFKCFNGSIHVIIYVYPLKTVDWMLEFLPENAYSTLL